MNKQELFLKTVFACMSCDGEIAPTEIKMVHDLIENTDLFTGFDVEAKLNEYIKSINKNGVVFLNQFLSEIGKNELSNGEQMCIVDLAIKTIEADNNIEYSEIKFFKKIRARLSITDEEILAKYPDKGDFLLPDINVNEAPVWDDITFNEISLK